MLYRDFPYISLHHCAIFWYNRALFASSHSQSEVSICFHLLVINVKCAHIVQQIITVAQKLFYLIASLFDCHILQKAFWMSSLLKFVFAVAFRLAHCVAALRCQIEICGERLLRAKTVKDQMGQAHNGHQEHEEAFR